MSSYVTDVLRVSPRAYLAVFYCAPLRGSVLSRLPVGGVLCVDRRELHKPGGQTGTGKAIQHEDE